MWLTCAVSGPLPEPEEGWLQAPCWPSLEASPAPSSPQPFCPRLSWSSAGHWPPPSLAPPAGLPSRKKKRAIPQNSTSENYYFSRWWRTFYKLFNTINWVLSPNNLFIIWTITTAWALSTVVLLFPWFARSSKHHLSSEVACSHLGTTATGSFSFCSLSQQGCWGIYSLHQKP